MKSVATATASLRKTASDLHERQEIVVGLIGNSGIALKFCNGFNRRRSGTGVSPVCRHANRQK
jgi:hypothetical protein